MAESIIISIGSKLLATLVSPAFKKAYERIRSVLDARDDLEELRDTINAINTVLFDAEKRRDGSETVKHWIERVKDVLYDVEDLFDVVATEDILKQQKKGNKHLKDVQVFFSKQNQIASSDNIAKMVKEIRKDFCRIKDDIGTLNFHEYEYKMPKGGIRPIGYETGSFVASDDVIGRENEKQQVLAFLYNESYRERRVSLVSIVGIGGMGKTSLAQLIYNDAEIENDFKNRRYWVCISDIFEEKEVLGRICQGMAGVSNYRDLSLDQLQSKIRGVLDSEVKFLLVLDDMWDENTARGRNLWSLLSSGNAKGSKIIITTRMSSVAKAMKTDETLELKGLSSDASWDLFAKYAFTEEQKNDPIWISVGKKIVKKCVNVPLAIKSVACLLSSKDTIEEWRSIEDVELSKVQISEDPIMSSLRLSYDHLPLHLKNCFAYCSLYPKDTWLYKQTLIYLWIAQGYVHPKNGETLEMAGHAYFMELCRRSFLQGPDYVLGYFRMHDLVHDLAKNVAGQEIVILTEDKNKPQTKIRHVYVDFETSESHSIQLPLLKPGQLCSLLFRRRKSSFDSKLVLFVEIKNYVFLRSLDLTDCVDEVPESIGDLTYLRYLSLSKNKFKRLPDSITDLVNLVTLDISCCDNLIELPRDIGKLINLRHLENWGSNLEKMPLSFGELTSLQHLDEFRVHGTDERSCGVDALDKMNLQGKLKISSDRDNGCGKVLDFGRISYTLEALEIYYFPGLIKWTLREDLGSQMPKLERLVLMKCDKIKHITPLIRSLPYLKHLSLYSLDGVEYIEDEEIVSPADFWPCLQTLEFHAMYNNLKGWSRHVIPEQPFFPRLSALTIKGCPYFESMPLAPHLKSLSLSYSNSRLTTQLMSTSTRLEDIIIHYRPNISSIGGECLTSLRKLGLYHCTELRDIKLAPSVLEELDIDDCEKLKLVEHDCGDTLSSEDCMALQNLRSLSGYAPCPERLSKCLQRLVIDGQLQIQGYFEDELERTLASYTYDTQSGSANQLTNEGNTISKGINSESRRQLNRDESRGQGRLFPLLNQRFSTMCTWRLFCLCLAVSVFACLRV